MSIKNIPSNDVATFAIKVNGTIIPDAAQVVSFEVKFSVNKISEARIVIIDGNSSTGNFEISSSSTFVPGGDISIDAGYNGTNHEIYKGIIVSQNITINNTKGSILRIICRDKSIKTTVGKKSKTYYEKTDNEIIASVVASYSGLSFEGYDTINKSPQMVQYYASDWDFILARAEANGFMVNTINGKVSLQKPTIAIASVLELTYGESIFDFNGHLNSINQLDTVKASSWDYESQDVVSETSNNTYTGAGNLSSKKLSEVVDLDTYELQSPVSLNKDDLTRWSEAQITKSELAKFCGKVVCQGTGLVLPGNFVTLSGLGNRFNGDHFVSGVTQKVKEGIWITEIEFGHSAKWVTETKNSMAPPAAGLLPGVHGLFTATVKKTYEDPDNQYRILIDLPLFDPEGEGLWARHGSFYASSNAGAFFLPEVGDEVIVGFLNEDPRYPIILGSLYSREKLKPFNGIEPNQNNSLKAIVSKSGISVSFDDENQIFTITTPSKNTAIFSDQEKGVIIQDENENSIVMSEDGIHIKSSKSITVESTENLSLKGTNGVSIESSGGDISITGKNIDQAAEVSFSANGSASAGVETSGNLTLKGALVMIN